MRDLYLCFIFIRIQFKMSGEQLNPCVICNFQYDEMLMLTCMHDPCLKCASKHYVANQPENSIKYTCSKCGQKTELDSTSIIQLKRVYQKLNSHRKYDYKKNLPSANRQKPFEQDFYNRNPGYNHSEYEEPYATRTHKQETDYQHHNYTPSHVLQANYKSPPPKRYICKDHLDEQLTYFCFTCIIPICPECAIHGSHREHEVQSVKKSIRRIKDQLKQDIRLVEGLPLIRKKQQNKRWMKQVSENNKKDHEVVKNQFVRLRGLLAEKEKQFFTVLDQGYDSNCQEIKKKNAILDAKAERSIRIKKQLQGYMQKDDITILQQFGQKHLNTMKFVKEHEQNQKQLNVEQCSVFKSQDFQQQMEQLMKVIRSLQLSMHKEIVQN